MPLQISPTVMTLSFAGKFGWNVGVNQVSSQLDIPPRVSVLIEIQIESTEGGEELNHIFGDRRGRQRTMDGLSSNVAT
jgi:hypothetical protein